MKRRVVITGMGSVSCLGNNVETLWQHIQQGHSGITHLEGHGFEGIDTRIAGQIKDLDTSLWLDKKEINRFDPMIQYGYIAARQALDQAGITADNMDPDRVGIYIGSGAGGLHTLLENHKNLLEKGAKRVSPFTIPLSIHNMVSGLTAIKTGFTGPSFAPVSACASSNHAIGEAYLHIAHGYSDAMLAGGADATINPFYFAGFSKMNAMSRCNDEPQKASRPFDKNRDGFVMAEGAGVLFLESYQHAIARGAPVLGEIVGYAATTDAHHMTSPAWEGAAKAMRLAIERAETQPRFIDYINAHGTSTPTGDLSETKAIQSVFGATANQLKVSSTKSMTGHMFGAAGGVEAIITARSLAEGIIPPTINLDTPDPACSLDYVPHTKQTKVMSYALSNGFGFGGHNAVLVFKKV